MSKEALAECEQGVVDYRVQVAYQVPVEVVVDLKSGRVGRVVVVDESTAFDPEEGARQEGTLHPIPRAIAKQALEIAEADNWPVWEHGF